MTPLARQLAAALTTWGLMLTLLWTLSGTVAGVAIVTVGAVGGWVISRYDEGSQR